MGDELRLSPFILSFWDANNLKVIGLIEIGKVTHLHAKQNHQINVCFQFLGGILNSIQKYTWRPTACYS